MTREAAATGSEADVRLLLLRHGSAGRRRDWDGDDADRPLDVHGRRQADEVPGWLEREGVHATTLVSSSMLRCVQTLAPLAHRLGLPIVEDDRLAEIEVPVTSEDRWPDAAWLGGRALPTVDAHLPDPAGTLVVCSHGEILPALLAALAGRVGAGLPAGLDLTRKRLAKGGAWLVELPSSRAETGTLRGRELAPPDDRPT